jgi:hypothetical protein
MLNKFPVEIEWDYEISAEAKLSNPTVRQIQAVTIIPPSFLEVDDSDFDRLKDLPKP